MSARAIDAAFDAEARSICDGVDAWRAAIRDLARTSTPTGEAAAAIIATRVQLDSRVEKLRRRYLPRASRLIVSDGRAITVSRTARSARTVWSTR
ncbi:hypothetical protein [Serinibacter salmoneus]|uniref:Uncharacterized protein n=1 Tax=Serinibacter salmoneus TaxID=556530 RepID=A0A2A9CZN2_9MICO|nr:hypothetical protein [Serinibacter salmoneus]PFG19897.1 hypothetical protein ATL40_1474 [Serinibacter salmoneus]